jgi:hypothetical protein
MLPRKITSFRAPTSSGEESAEESEYQTDGSFELELQEWVYSPLQQEATTLTSCRI